MLSYLRNEGATSIAIAQMLPGDESASATWRIGELATTLQRVIQWKKFVRPRIGERADRSSGGNDADLEPGQKQEPNDRVIPPFFYCP
jgi:hypothetical protein